MESDDGMAGLVVGRHSLLVFGHHHGLAFAAHQDLVLGFLELLHRNEALSLARSKERRLVNEIREVSARESGGSAGNHTRIDVRRQRHSLHMHAEDLLAAIDVGPRNDDLPIEAAGTQKRRIENVRAVGRGDDDDAFVRLEAVHLDQELVQGLLALVVAIAEAGAAMATDGVDLVDEDDAGRRLLGLVEHVANSACADADEHFDEVRTGNCKERNASFTRNGAGEQGLAGARRTDEQRALGILPPRRANLPGSFRYSTISCSSSRASSMPATSANVTRPCFSVSIRARLLPKPIAPEPAFFCICRITNKLIPTISRNGSEL